MLTFKRKRPSRSGNHHPVVGTRYKDYGNRSITLKRAYGKLSVKTLAGYASLERVRTLFIPGLTCADRHWLCGAHRVPSIILPPYPNQRARLPEPFRALPRLRGDIYRQDLFATSCCGAGPPFVFARQQGKSVMQLNDIKGELPLK